MEMNQRQKQLESDITLISTIRNFLMSNRDTDLSQGQGQPKTVRQNFRGDRSPLDDVPVRDEPKCSNSKCKSSFQKTNAGKTNNAKSEPLPSKLSNVTTTTSELDANVNDTTKPQREELRVKIEEEKRRRHEVEDSAKIIALRLQKTEDELVREQETKRNLLVGTLEMKNQLQGYQHQFAQMEEQLLISQKEKQGLQTDVRLAEDAKTQLEVDFKSQMKLSEEEKLLFIQEKEEIKNKVDSLTKECAELKVDNCLKTEQLAGHDQILKEMGNLSSKCLQVEQERGKVVEELRFANEKLEAIKSTTESADVAFQLHKQTSESEIQLKSEEISELKATISKLKSHHTSAKHLVSSTKSFILSLQQEKQKLIKDSKKQQIQFQHLLQEKSELGSKLKDLSEEISQLNQQIVSSNQQHFETNLKLQNLEEIKKKQEDTLRQKDNQIAALRTRLEGFENEIKMLEGNSEQEKLGMKNEAENLRNEISRLTENSKILQKISEDQSKTISKQRDNLESNVEVRHNLKMQLREFLSNEKVLMNKLKQEEESNQSLLFKIRRLETQLEEMEHEVKGHDCEEFVESKLVSKFEEMKRDKAKWESETRRLEKERDLALAAARKALRQTEEMKESCKNRLLKMGNCTTEKVLKIQEEMHLQEGELGRKIRDLEAELVRVKDTNVQLQSAYLGRIQQLQNVLSACIGNNNFGLYSGFGQNISNHNPFP